MSDQAEMEAPEVGGQVAVRTEAEVLPELPRAVTPDMGALMERAIDKGVEGVDALERMVAMMERREERDARMAFVHALARFQSEVGPVPKTAKVVVEKGGNKSVRSTFSPLPVIADHVREPLARNGLSYTWNSKVDGKMVDVWCRLTHVEGHFEESHFEFPYESASAPGMNGVQIAGSARTYGERYSLIQVLGLTTADVDDDGGHDDSPEPVSDEQLAVLLEHVEGLGDSLNLPRFLAWLRVGELAELPAKDYDVALNALKAKAIDAA